jgi:hypothetical protein
MNELKQFIINQIDEYREKHNELLFNEESIMETRDEDMEYLTLYEGIIEGLSIVLLKIKKNEDK